MFHSEQVNLEYNQTVCLIIKFPLDCNNIWLYYLISGSVFLSDQGCSTWKVGITL